MSERIPTVTLKHSVYGLLNVNQVDYAANIGGWVNKGWKLVKETDLGNPVELVSAPEPEPEPESAPAIEPEPEPTRAPEPVHRGKRGGRR